MTVETVPPLSKEQAMADTLRALKECYPDRWERIWTALGMESSADRTVAEVVRVAVAHPGAAMGALVGGIIGAALGRK